MTRATRFRHVVLAAVLGLGLSSVAWQSAARSEAGQTAPPDRSAWRWYKGNTHTHTLESDGDSTPEDVTRWYREHGYNFLVLSDHNVLTRIDTLSTQFGAPGTFILVPGEEVTDKVGDKPLHLNGLNLRQLVMPRGGATVREALQKDIDAIRGADGVPHINHPNFEWGITQAELAVLERYKLFEIFNGHPMVNNLGGGDAPGTEPLWDHMLKAGKRVYGIAVDDAHYFKRPWDPLAPKPGRGWVVVRAPRLDPIALVASLEAGDFYASTGVELDRYEADTRRIELRVRVAGQTRYRVRLIVAGAVVDTRDGPDVRFNLGGRRGYARVVVTDSNGATAWGQPVFLD